MKVLYLDTSSSFLYAGIVEEEKLLSSCKKNLFHDLSKDALPEIIHLFEQAQLTPQEIDKIIVVNGPGSFTGIRVGITIAKVYAWSLKIPITTITSLEAMMLSSNRNTYHIPVIDARRGFVFAAIYDKENRQVLPPQYIQLDELLQKLEENEYVAITNDEIELPIPTEEYDPDIVKIVSTYKNKKEISAHAINPEYLKKTEAEEKKG